MPSASAAAPAPTARLSHSYFFANAASTGNDIYNSLPRNVWFQRFIYILNTFAIPLACYFRPLCTAVALFWLVYRASQVLNTPLKDLSSLLGLDLPATPHIDLASIKADGAIIHWTLPERPKQKKEHKFAVHLNGTIIGTVSVYESAVTIVGLQPGCFYVARVALVNSHEFSSKSAAVRFETKAATSGDYFVAGHDGHETDADSMQEPVPRIRPYRALKDITPASPLSAPMTREGSTGLAPRRISGRRPSPATLGLVDKHDPQPEDSEAPEGAETIQQLTERLDALRRDNDEAERLAKEEEEEELRQKEELIKERDELRAELNEKEKASKNLKREVNALERQNTAAQNERAKQERALQQKMQDRQKLKDDMVRWERETEQMQGDTERLHQEKEQYLEQAEKEKASLRARVAEETAAIRTLDDEVKEKTGEIKKLERALKNSSPDGTTAEPNLVQQMQSDAEDERNWQAHKHALQQQYAMAYQKLEAARRFHAEQVRYLESLRMERRRQEEMAQFASPPVTQDRLPRRGDSQRSRHAPSRHSVSDSPRLAAFPPSTQSPFASTINPVTSGFNSAPFLNIQNGMTIPNPTDEVSLSDEDRDKLTGGAMMSPGAGADLLPADLFSGDDNNRREHVQPLPGLGSLPGLPGLPGGPTPAFQEYPGAGPASPGSASSRSPSVFASPQASQHNLTYIGSPDGVLDADRRSIRSTRSNRAPSGGTSSRFSGMFGIKQRSKNLSDDAGPMLSKASSMPRQDQGIIGLDAATRKRTSSISGTVFQNPGYASSLDETTDAASATAGAGAPVPSRSRAFGLFSRDKSGGWPSTFTAFGRRPTSPRPGSTHSTELPKPSVDSSRWGVDGWPSGDANGGARNSPLSFGPGWNLPSAAAGQQSRMYGSRHPSRRPSVQYGASGPPEDIMEDEDSDALDGENAPHLAPIGTKPPSGSTPKKSAGTADGAGGKLNPNAKAFSSFLSSMKFVGKDKGSSPFKDGDASSTPSGPSSYPGGGSAAFGVPSGLDGEDDSPPASRKSRDTRSMTTTESSLLESGRTSSDLARTPSYSNYSDVGAQQPQQQQQQQIPAGGSPSLAGSSKETFMQKISRKSSSSKFTLPTFKRNSSRLDTVAGVGVPTSAPRDGFVGESAEEEDGGELSASVSSLRESRELGRGSTRSWSNVLKLGKGKKERGDETPSLSGVSREGEEESETGEE